MTEATRETSLNQPIDVRAEKPAGLIPKNIQSWVIVGISVVMILVMWLTAGKSKNQPGSVKTVAAPATYNPTLVPLNDAKIEEMQKRIEELQLEQTQVAREAQAAGINPAAIDGAVASGAPSTQPVLGAGGQPPTQENPIEAAEKQRAYVARFASNIALSYRPDMKAKESSSSSNEEPALINNPPAVVAAPVPPSAPPPAPPVQAGASVAPVATAPQQAPSSAEDSPKPKEESRNPDVAQPGAANSSTGERYVLFEGTILETLLINRLDGSFSGPVNCMVTTDIYSHDRQHLLVPAGTKVLGETRKVEAFGQNRLAVVFHRLIMPDGYSVSLDQFKGLNQVGETALKDKVNNHYIQIFGVSLAVGLLGAVAESGTGNAFDQSATDRLRSDYGSSIAGSSDQILDKFLNVPPTVTIREGSRVKIYLSDDLLLPDYQLHTVRPNL
jgi:type IV secretion system protein VirB10